LSLAFLEVTTNTGRLPEETSFIGPARRDFDLKVFVKVMGLEFPIGDALVDVIEGYLE